MDFAVVSAESSKRVFDIWPQGGWVMVAFVAGFVLAQLVKLIIFLITSEQKTAKEAIEYLTRSGGMPSGHTASLGAALLVSLYLEITTGGNMLVSAALFCVFCLTVYDATHVRFAVGEHGKMLKEVTEKGSYKHGVTKVVEGHTVAQIVGGVLVAILTAGVIIMIGGGVA